ncbi:hypothetical protein SEVIR_7G283750v4 [Setaria viridis]
MGLVGADVLVWWAVVLPRCPVGGPTSPSGGGGQGRGGRGRRRQRGGQQQRGGEEAPCGGRRGPTGGGIRTEVGVWLHGVNAKEVERHGPQRLAHGAEGGGAEWGKERTGQRRRTEGGRSSAWLHDVTVMAAK